MPFRTPDSKSLSFHVPSDIGAVPSTRHRVVAIVSDWDLPLAEETVHTLELLTGEVVANAVVHTGECCQVTVSWDGLRVRLEAEDTKGGQLPKRMPADLNGESGRGLQLVEGLAQAWGCRPTKDGKAVWFEIGGCTPLTSGPPPAASEGDSEFRGGAAQRLVAMAEPGSRTPSGPRTTVAVIT